MSHPTSALQTKMILSWGLSPVGTRDDPCCAFNPEFSLPYLDQHLSFSQPQPELESSPFKAVGFGIVQIPQSCSFPGPSAPWGTGEMLLSCSSLGAATPLSVPQAQRVQPECQGPLEGFKCLLNNHFRALCAPMLRLMLLEHNLIIEFIIQVTHKPSSLSEWHKTNTELSSCAEFPL